MSPKRSIAMFRLITLVGMVTIAIAGIFLVFNALLAAELDVHGQHAKPVIAKSLQMKIGADWFMESETSLLYEHHRIEFRDSIALVRDAHGNLIRPELPDFVGAKQARASRADFDGPSLAATRASGWPFRTWLASSAAPSRDGPWKHRSQVRWVGVANSLLLAFAVGACVGTFVWWVPRRVLAMWRTQLGRCPACGYEAPSSGQRLCPECGSLASRR